MNYEKDAKKTGISNISLGLIVFFALILLQYFFISRSDVSGTLMVAIWLIGGFVALVFAWQGVSLLRSGGKWMIVIDDDGINWSSPNESVDKSFNLKFSEIALVETREKYKKGSQMTSRDHVLVLQNGLEIKLSPNSGISLVQVVLELERKGVSHKVICS